MLTNWNTDLPKKKMYKHINQFCVTHLIYQHLKLSNLEGIVKEKGTLKKFWKWILKENTFSRKAFILDWGVL